MQRGALMYLLTQGEPMARPTPTTSVRQAFAHVYIIDLAGELTSSVDAALLKAYQQASSDARVVILNFSHLAYKNSSGIKLLVKLLTSGTAAGQRLFAVGLNAEYRNIFRVTQLDLGITVYASEADALQAARDVIASGNGNQAGGRGNHVCSEVWKDLELRCAGSEPSGV